ncbi:MAG TPA: hypothetical protein VNR70_11225 [Steroidobacteraceae bacterium]|nr:hypothetical protein [Steroidobacteraceae bacterium]
MATTAKAARAKLNTAMQHLAADAERAAAHAELAKRQVRSAKSELKKARKLSKAAKKVAKQARKKAEVAAAAVKRADARAVARAKAAAGAKPEKSPKAATPAQVNSGTKLQGGAKTGTARQSSNSKAPEQSKRARAAVPKASPAGKPHPSAADVARSVIKRLAATKRANSQTREGRGAAKQSETVGNAPPTNGAAMTPALEDGGSNDPSPTAG